MQCMIIFRLNGSFHHNRNKDGISDNRRQAIKPLIYHLLPLTNGVISEKNI